MHLKGSLCGPSSSVKLKNRVPNRRFYCTLNSPGTLMNVGFFWLRCRCTLSVVRNVRDPGLATTLAGVAHSDFSLREGYFDAPVVLVHPTGGVDAPSGCVLRTFNAPPRLYHTCTLI